MPSTLSYVSSLCHMPRLPFFPTSDLLRLDRNNADAIYVKALCFYYQVSTVTGMKHVRSEWWFISNSSVFQDVPDKATQFFQHALRVAPDHTKSRLAMKVGVYPFTLHSVCASWHYIRSSNLHHSPPPPHSSSLLLPPLLLLPLLPPLLLLLCSPSSPTPPLFSLPLLFQKSKSLLAKKEEGNRAFRSGENHRAYDIYSEALKIDPLNTFTNAKLFCNRALVGSKVSQHQVAIATRLLMFGP